MPPAAGSETALSTSSTDSGVSRSSASRTMSTMSIMPKGRERSGTAAAPPDLAHDRRGPDDGDRGARRGDRRVLLVQPAARHRVVPTALLEQDLQRGLVVERGL